MASNTMAGLVAGSHTRNELHVLHGADEVVNSGSLYLHHLPISSLKHFRIS